jgi:hypothetical protein
MDIMMVEWVTTPTSKALTTSESSHLPALCSNRTEMKAAGRNKRIEVNKPGLYLKPFARKDIK